MLVLNAAAISEGLSLPAVSIRGQIRSLHRDYVNILTSGGIVTLVRSGMDHIPFGIEVDLVGEWLDFELELQQEVLFTDAVMIGDILTVQGLQTCPRFSCRYRYDPLSAGTVDFLPRLRQLEQFCYHADKKEGILSYIGQYNAELFCNYGSDLPGTKAAQAVNSLINGIRENKENLISQGICGLLGVGPGSTPSGDDFLLGFFSGISHVQPENCRQAARIMANLLVENASQLTTFMSVEYIKYGIKGLYHQRVGELIDAVGAATEQEMISKAGKLTQLGHFSGVDFLVGFVYGGFIALFAGTPLKRKELANENS